MAKEYIFGQMGENMMENGKMEDNMAKVNTFLQPDNLERVYGNLANE